MTFMARPLRLEFADALYHVTSRGNERRPLFRTIRDRQQFLLFLGIAVKRFWGPKWGHTFVLRSYRIIFAQVAVPD